MSTRTSVEGRKRRPTPLQTSITRPSTAPHTGFTPTSAKLQTPPQLHSTPEDARPNPDMKQREQYFVLTDPVAFRYLEEDPSTTVLGRRKELRGYECYAVEQWTTSRTHPTMMITTYTGDASHQVVVDVLSVPTDETTWSTRLRVYFKALNHYHATRRQTELGVLMVTNLSSFPSSLTVIPVPDGDIRKHRFDFFVNENLKRLGCSGRVGLTLAPPALATVAKFHQLYRTSDKNEIYQSVVELVKLCQSALMLFDKLEIDYADGLLCDVTERAINDWWIEIGSDQYNLEPQDGILGPTTVAGLLGLLMGARNRLHAVNAPVSKDAFDVEAMKRGISHFQKQQRMTRTRRLDRKTLERLQKATQKAANSEGFTLPKAVKSTVAELSGKGGEMVMEVVGRRDRAGIADIETCDIERFVQLAYGDRCKWLWLGKALKKTHERNPSNMPETGSLNQSLVFKPDDHGGYSWTARKSLADGLPRGKINEPNDMDAAAGQNKSDSEDEDVAGTTIRKRTSGLAQDAKVGIGKLRDAVGFKGHPQKPSVDEPPRTPTEESSRPKRPLFRRAQTSPLSSPNSTKSPTQDQRLDAAVREQHDRVATDPVPSRTVDNFTFPSKTGEEEGNTGPSQQRSDGPTDRNRSKSSVSDEASEKPSTAVTAEPSIAGSVYNDIDINSGALPTNPETEQDIGNLLRHTVSFSHFTSLRMEPCPSDAYPRHLSFSLAEESVLTWRGILAGDTLDTPAPKSLSAQAQLAEQELLAKEFQRLYRFITALTSETAEWTQEQLQSLNQLLAQGDEDENILEEMYRPHHEQIEWLHASTEGVLREQKERFEGGVQEVETLVAKLDYELGGLRSRVEDVEAGVGDFEKGVRRVEERVEELEKEEDRRSWGCVVC